MATIKQKKAVREVLKGTTITEAMKKAGYSETTASTTGKLTRTKGWEELMEQYLPDKDLAKVHQEGLSASKKIIVEGKDLGIQEPEYAVRHKYLDSAYKLKGRYAAEKYEHSIGRKTEGTLSEEELNKLKEVFKDDKENNNI